MTSDRKFLARQTSEAQIGIRPDGATKGHLAWLACCSVLLSFLLILTIRDRSLGADEAFSAYLASHRNITSLLRTLAGGDSGDLQMGLHYIYLHLWSQHFGTSEVGLRSANIPFICVFALVLIWTSRRLFQSYWVWIVPATLPFLWAYASDGRPYFAVVCFSTICFAGLLAYLDRPSRREQIFLPWIVLTSLLLGSAFHMLMLLAVPPMLTIIWVYSRSYEKFRLDSWKPALWTLALPFAFLLAYIAWTFQRGTNYFYVRPSILSMASVMFRFLGLFGYGPNRRYDIPFGPYLPAMALSTVGLLLVAAGLSQVKRDDEGKLRFKSVCWALIVAVVQVTLLCFLSGQQVDLRHLAALAPLLLMLVGGGLSGQDGKAMSKVGVASAGLLVLIWVGSDARFLLSPEYRDDDFRSAVAIALNWQKPFKADVAIVSDPIGAAYYGLDVKGPRPCFPLADDCESGFQKVNWTRKAPAAYATSWSSGEVKSWLDARMKSGTPVVVIMNRSRVSMYKDSPWWSALEASPYQVHRSVHGFFVYFLNNSLKLKP